MKGKAGFTLTEVMVVLAIIVVLAGIAWPVSTSMIRRAKEASCLGNLRSIGIGLQGYLQEHGNKLPTLVAGRKTKSEEVPVIDVVLMPYLENPEAFRCPSDPEQFEKSGSSYLWNATQNGLHISKLSFFGIEDRPESIPLVMDKEAWHGGSTNFLYADSSASNQLRMSARKPE